MNESNACKNGHGEQKIQRNSKMLLVPESQMFAKGVLRNCVFITVARSAVRTKHTQVHNQNKNYTFKTVSLQTN